MIYKPIELFASGLFKFLFVFRSQSLEIFKQFFSMNEPNTSAFANCTLKMLATKKAVTFISIKAKKECYKLNNQGPHDSIILKFYTCFWTIST